MNFATQDGSNHRPGMPVDDIRMPVRELLQPGDYRAIPIAAYAAGYRYVT